MVLIPGELPQDPRGVLERLGGVIGEACEAPKLEGTLTRISLRREFYNAEIGFTRQ